MHHKVPSVDSDTSDCWSPTDQPNVSTETNETFFIYILPKNLKALSNKDYKPASLKMNG
jgi:hypothetical protein